MKSVIIDKEFSYKLDAAAKRTLPAGWKGEVEDEVWKQIKAEKKGRLAPGIQSEADAKAAADAKATADSKAAAQDPDNKAD